MTRFFRRKAEAAEAPAESAAPTELAAPPEAPKTVDQAVERTRRTWFSRIGGMFRRGLDDALWDELEETLIAADTGAQTTARILDGLKQRVKSEGIRDPEQALAALKEELAAILDIEPRGKLWRGGIGEGGVAATFRSPGEGLRPGGDGSPPQPAVILVVGVNGTGKTTSIGKLAHAYKAQGKKVVLAAGDTFRAAAIDQLKQWGQRASASRGSASGGGIDVVAHQQGADPGAVVFDSLVAAEKRNADVLIIDTAGRLHTKINLMEELRKVNRVIQRKLPDAPHEVLLVLDATTGQNALHQAKYFTEAVGVTGILLAKLDGTAKGGVIFAVCDQLGVPVRFVGTGEKPQDLAPFQPREFVEALFA